MAVDLATSGSLGYGIGLQGKVPDKSNLVLQLENQRLKRQALKGQEEEEKQKKEEKQLNLLAKGLNVDATEWHRTLVTKVNKFANEAMGDFYKLYQTNPKLAINSIPQVMRSFEEKVSPLKTTNAGRKADEKDIDRKIINQERLPDEMIQYRNYLSYGDDASLTDVWESDLGTYKITPDSIVTKTVIPKSTAEEDAKVAARSVGDLAYTPSDMGIISTRVYDDASVLGYMNERYKDEQKKLSDIAYISPTLKKVWKESGLEGQGVKFSKFLTDPTYAKDVENVLLEYNKSLLAKNAPAPTTQDVKANVELEKLANSLKYPKRNTITGEFIYTTEGIAPEKIESTWNAYKESPFGKAVITLAGGEKAAKTIYENAVRPPRKGVRERYKEMDFGAGGFEVGSYKLTENPPIEEKIFKADVQEDLDKYKETLYNIPNSDVLKDTEGNYVDKDGKILDDDYFIKRIEQYSAEKGEKAPPMFVETKNTSILTLPTGSKEAKAFATSQRWSTGKSGKYGFVEGIFSYLVKDNATNEIIGVAVRPKIGEDQYGATRIVPFNADNKGKFGAGKETKVEGISGGKKYYTKDGIEVDVTDYSQDQINKAIKNKLIFAK